MECINCTACIDQCDSVMKRVGKEPGLIRYVSEHGIQNKQKSIWNTRNKAYSVILVILLSFFIYTLATRPVIETTILRTPGLLYQVNDDNTISNVYNIKLVNKTHDKMPLEIKLLSHEGRIQMAGNKMEVDDQAMFQSTFLLFLERDQLKSETIHIEFGIYSGGELIETYRTTFIGP